MPGGPGAPGGAPRDERLAGFAQGGPWDTSAPGAELAAVLAAVSGPEWRCPGATEDEMFGVLRRLTDVESWAAAGRLGVIRELIRRDDMPFLERPRHGDLPDEWSQSLDHQLAHALASSVTSAEKTAVVAWELGARLPGIAALLADGTLTYGKARLITETFQWLSDGDAARAEALLIPELTGPQLKTYGQLLNLATRIAVQVDPGFAERRRKAAVKENARVRMFREESGAAALSGRDLPTDQTLTAWANASARAQEYKGSGAFPDVRMGRLLATAYLDLLNEIPVATRIALGRLSTGDGDGDGGGGDGGDDDGDGGDGEGGDGGDGGTPPGPEAGAWGDNLSDRNGDGPPGHGSGAEGAHPPGGDQGGPGGPGGPGGSGPGSAEPGNAEPGNAEPGNAEPGNAEPGNAEPGDGGSGDGERGVGGSGDIEPGDDDPGDAKPGNYSPGSAEPGDGGSGGGAGPTRLRLVDLILPLATLLGLAERPGEGHGLGTLDPALCRDLAAAAVGSPRTELCVTVTDPDGIAIGHGCAKPRLGDAAGQEAVPGTAASARVNLTITESALRGLVAGSRGRPAPWSFTPIHDSGTPPGGDPPPEGTPPEGTPPESTPPDGYGTWALTAPGGRAFTVRLEPVPAFSCDHRHESRGYQPNDKLRHLVQIRDHTCTNPVCSRHARDSDFEHAIPYHKGGRTCACNAGARSRSCHKIKQSPGWKVTQPRPGWHQWQTPSGRVYTKGPYHYPTLPRSRAPDRARFQFPGGAGDAEAVAALHADSWQRHYRGAFSDAFLDGDAEAYLREQWTARLAAGDQRACTILAEHDGAVVGLAHTILGEHPSWGALLDNLHVAYGLKWQGIGTRLLALTARAVVDEAPGSGLYLWVLEQNTRARAFYAAQGGECVGQRMAEPPGGDPARLNGTPIGLRIAWRDPSTLLSRP